MCADDCREQQLGAPFTNRRVIAQRLAINRHLAKANGGPVVIEFDDCIPEPMKERLRNGNSLVRRSPPPCAALARTKLFVALAATDD